MKKFSIITLFLALLTMTVQAQENTYNMVIEMTNGTKITIGPNDIRSLTFNNGELTVTGQSLQSWMESVPKRVELDELRAAIEYMRSTELLDLETLKEYFGIDSYWGAGKEVSEALVNRLAQHDAMMQKLLIPLVNYFGNGYDIDAYEVSEALVNRLLELQGEIYELYDRIAILENRIANLEAQ